MNYQNAQTSLFSKSTSPVEVYTEWDPLEEVLVGIVDDIRVPDWDKSVRAVIPKKHSHLFKVQSGQRFPEELVRKAREEVNTLAKILEAQGIRVKRPNESEHHQSISTPYFTTTGTFYSAMPRDCLFAVGKKIIEVPMAWRSRYFETFPYREILNEYFENGAEWVSAPKPMLSNDIWNGDYEFDQHVPFRSMITEAEPLFDAADFVRMGRDIIGQRSHVTNNKGIEWLRRLLGPEFNVHIYEFEKSQRMHIDTTILPLAPGRVLINKSWVSKIPDIFKDWEILNPPSSSLLDSHPLYMSSRWIHMSVLMLDEKTVVVEKDESALISAFHKWGFKTILCPFKHFQTFGGSFHGATLDIKRSGTLKSYV